jgi:hypothetical protein
MNVTVSVFTTTDLPPVSCLTVSFTVSEWRWTSSRRPVAFSDTVTVLL